MELTLLVALCLATAWLTLVTRSNTKRINQLERDLSEQIPIPRTETVSDIAEKKAQAHAAVKEAEIKMASAEQVEKTLRQAGVKDEKAHIAARLAIAAGWQLLDIQENIKMVRYMRAQNGDVQKVNIYHGGKGGRRELFTVATAINHPTKGKTQLFRKYITQQELAAVLKNPRTHTEKGYYQGGGK